MPGFPIIVIGAGPQGLAAAAHLRERGIDTLVLERGDHAGAAVAEWGHVRLFSPWPELTDAAARRLLEPTGWSAPATGYPTGAEWVRGYLAPLAKALGERVRYGMTVTGVSRDGQSFVVNATDSDGHETTFLARAVIDASGTWHQPNGTGAHGQPVAGEGAAGDAVSYRIPDDVSALARRHTVVVGAGHSAIHTVLRLAELARRHPGTRVTWALRRPPTKNLLGGGDADELPERAALGAAARRVLVDEAVTLVTGFRVAEFTTEDSGVTLTAEDGREISGAAHVFVLTGFRPDDTMFSELRVTLDPTLQAVAGIAEEIDPSIHSCGTVSATGARQLAHPEESFFIVGTKSYGRAPTFLALTGYEQVRSVVAHLAGDAEAAARNELSLPSTGVCGGSGALDEASGGCCSAPTLQIGASAAR